ncbi:hypothetical protein Tco_0672508 [Tanacetum coccineum]
MMLKDISRDDLTELYRIVMNRYGMDGQRSREDKKLQGGKPDEDCYKMLKMMEKQAGAKGLTSPEQTATGKGISNPFMAVMIQDQGPSLTTLTSSSTKSQQAATRNKGKSIVNSSIPTYNQEPTMVVEDDEMSKDKEIDKLVALISLSFKKIYKPTNNNLRTSLNTSRANQDYSPRINSGTGYENQRVVNVAGARENVEQDDLKDDTDDESNDQELEAHYMYMAQIQKVTPDAANNSGPIFNAEPLHKVQNNNDNYNVFAIKNEHPEQPESVNDIYLEKQGGTNITIDSLDMCYDREHDDQDDTDELDQEHDLLASLIQKLKCKIDDNKNHNKFLETSNKDLVDKLKNEI